MQSIKEASRGMLVRREVVRTSFLEDEVQKLHFKE